MRIAIKTPLLPTVPTLMFGAVVLTYLAIKDALPVTEVFMVMDVGLAFYLAAEVLYHRRVNPERWLVLPPTIASIFTFLLSFCLSAFAPKLTPFSTFEITEFGNRAMLLAIIAAFAMWRGFDSEIGSAMSDTFSDLLRKVLRVSPDCSVSVIVLLVGIAIAGRLAMIWLGIYGYSADERSLTESIEYKQYLYYMDSCGSLALIAYAMNYYDRARPQKHSTVLLLAILCEEIGFGLLSGFKGMVIMPVIIVAFIRYLMTGTFSRKWLATAIVLLGFAYALIEPFRVLRYEDPSFTHDSVTGIAATMASVATSGEFGSGVFGEETLARLLERSDMVVVTGKGLEFVADGDMPENAPHFLSQIVLSPLMAYVPRAIWPDKPKEEIGGWFNQEVLGQREDLVTSVGMGPIVYLYFAGGITMVIIGFFAVGILQRFAGELLFAGAGAALIGLAILRPLIIVDSAYNTILVSLLRAVPMLIIAQLVIFRPTVGYTKHKSATGENARDIQQLTMRNRPQGF